MRRFIRKCVGILAAGGSALCSMNAADAIMAVPGNDDSVKIESLETDPEHAAKAAAMVAFAKSYTPRLLIRGASPEEAEHFLNLLEQDPGAVELVFMLEKMTRHDKALYQKTFARIIELADRNPDRINISLAAGEYAFQERDNENALRLLSRVFAVLTEQNTIHMILRDKPRVSFTALQNICAGMETLQIRMENYAELQNILRLFQQYPELQNSPVCLRERLISLYEEERLAGGYRPEPLLSMSRGSFLRAHAGTLVPLYIEVVKKQIESEKRAFTWLYHFPVLLDVLPRTGHADDLTAALQDILKKDQNNEIAWMILAKIYGVQKLYTEAAQAWRKFIALVPDAAPVFLYEYAQGLREIGEYKKAIGIYRKMKKSVSPGDLAKIDEEIVQTYLQMEDYKAVEQYVLKMPSGLYRHFFLIYSAYMQKKYPDAKKYVAAMLKDSGEWDMKMLAGSPVWLVSAMAAEKCGDIEMVEKIIRPQIKLSPDNPDLLNFLGYTLADRNRKLPEARGLIEKAMKLKPDSPEIVDSMAWVLYRQKDYQGARKYILQCLKMYESAGMDGPEATILDHAGDIFLALDDKKSACVYWRKALTAPNPEDLELAEIEKKLKKYGAGK